MIALKLVFQSLAGIASIGSICTGAYYFAPVEKTKFSYLIVTSKTITPGSTDANLQKKENEHYSCHMNQTVDNSCVIYSFNETNNKTIDLKALNTESSKITKAHTFTANQNYILKVEQGVFTESTGKTISLKNKSNVIFANLEIKDSFEPSYEKISSTLAIVKALTITTPAPTPTTLTSETKYLCKLGDSEAVECKLKKPATDINISNFSTTTLGTLTFPTAPTEIKQDYFYVVDFLKNEQSRTDLKNKTLTIFIKNEQSTNQQLATFKFEQLLIGKTTNPQDLFFIQENHENFLVTTISPQTSDQATTELITGETKKNYRCKWTPTGSNEVTDSSCELYKLTFDASKKTLSFPWESTSETLIKLKTELTTNTFFKLKVDGDKFKNLDSTTPVTIEVFGRENTDATKKYATATIKSHFSGNKLMGKTSLILGKASTITTDATSYKCKVEAATEDCDIYKFTTTSTPKESLIFSEATKVSAATDIKTTDFYVLDLKTKSIDLNSTLANIEVVKSDDSTPIFDFNIDTPLIADITWTNKQAILIK